MTTSAPTDDSVKRAAGIRHRLHQIPEIGYEEFKTAALIRAELDALGIPHVDGVAEAPTATAAWRRAPAPRRGPRAGGGRRPPPRRAAAHHPRPAHPPEDPGPGRHPPPPLLP